MSRDAPARRSRGWRRSWSAVALLATAPMCSALAATDATAAGEPTRAALGSVACPSRTLCIAVGSIAGINDSHPSKPLIMQGDGTRWTRMNVAAPVGSTNVAIGGVACTSTTHCFAVGGSATSSNSQPLIEAWDGAHWAVVPGPAGLPATSTGLGAVSCPTATSCFAIGRATTSTSATAVATHWDGTRWMPLISLARPAGATSAYLAGISCATSTSCFTVGTYLTKQDIKALVYRWNGLRWSIVDGPTFAGRAYPDLRGVSCPSVTSCYIAGSISTRYGIKSVRRVIEHWDGTRWTLTSFPKPSFPSTFDVFTGVSCSSTTSCMAVGYIERGHTFTFTERWDGVHWKVVASPSADAVWSELDAVACAAATSCAAVGITYDFDTKPLAEQWNGTRWAITFAPPQITS